MGSALFRRAAAGVPVAALLATACATTGSDPQAPLDDQPGVYEFEGQAPSTVSRPPLRGTLEVTADTVLVTLEGARCQPIWSVQQGNNLEILTYGCGEEVELTVNRAHPLRRLRALVVVQVPYERRVCEQYQDTPSGRVCVRSHTETAYRTERRTVPLRVTPRPGTGSPGHPSRGRTARLAPARRSP